MPALTQTFQAFAGGAVDGDNTNPDTVTWLRMLNGNNLGHSRHIYQYFKFRGSANSLGSNMDFLPGQVTKVEMRCYFGATWHQNGRATNPAQTFFLVPASETSTHPYGMWQTYYGIAASAQPLPNLMANWPTYPTNEGWSHEEGDEWFVLDDGTDLRSAFASNPNWDTGTGDAYNEGAIHLPIVYKMSVAGETGAADGGYFIDIMNYDGSVPVELRISYEADLDLTYNTGKSISSGSAPKTMGLYPHAIARWHGDAPELTSGSPCVPMITAGSGDLPPTNLIGTANPQGTDWFSWQNLPAPFNLHPADVCVRLSSTVPPAGGNGRPRNNYSIWCENYSGKNGFFSYKDPVWRTSRTNALGTYSGRFQMKSGNLPALNDPNPIAIQALKDGVAVWTAHYRTYSYEIVGNITNTHQLHIWNNIDNVWSGYTATRYLTDWHQWEFQCSNQAEDGNTLRIRFYNEVNDRSAPNEEWAIPVSDVTADEFVFGLATTVSPTAHTYYNDIEIFDDYWCGGIWQDESRYGELYSFEDWAEFEYDGTDWKPIDFVGEVTQVSPLVVDTNYDFDPQRDYEGEIWPFDSDTSGVNPLWTLTSDNYSNQGSGLHRINIYTPTASPPPGGWPIFVWLHGGFFISGDEWEIPTGLVSELVKRGYAVASIQVVLSTLEPVINRASGSGSQAYPAWNVNGNTARHPTQILDYKLAVAWLQEAAQKSTYNLNGDVIVGGHSAGGYPAMMAMLTKDVTDDGTGLSYRLQDHTVDYGYPNIPDPEIKGCYVWSAPTDFEKLRDYDPTWPDLPFSNTGQGLMETTIQLYFGLNFGEQPSSAELLGSTTTYHALYAPIDNLQPIGYSGGETDYLVPAINRLGGEGQMGDTEVMYGARGRSTYYHTIIQKEVQHYQSVWRRDPQHLEAFLNFVKAVNA